MNLKYVIKKFTNKAISITRRKEILNATFEHFSLMIYLTKDHTKIENLNLKIRNYCDFTSIYEDVKKLFPYFKSTEELNNNIKLTLSNVAIMRHKKYETRKLDTIWTVPNINGSYKIKISMNRQSNGGKVFNVSLLFPLDFRPKLRFLERALNKLKFSEGFSGWINFNFDEEYFSISYFDESEDEILDVVNLKAISKRFSIVYFDIRNHMIKVKNLLQSLRNEFKNNEVILKNISSGTKESRFNIYIDIIDHPIHISFDKNGYELTTDIAYSGKIDFWRLDNIFKDFKAIFKHIFKDKPILEIDNKIIENYLSKVEFIYKIPYKSSFRIDFEWKFKNIPSSFKLVSTSISDLFDRYPNSPNRLNISVFEPVDFRKFIIFSTQCKKILKFIKKPIHIEKDYELGDLKIELPRDKSFIINLKNIRNFILKKVWKSELTSKNF